MQNDTKYTTKYDTKCCGTGCPFKINCYRFKEGPVLLFETYFDKVPYDKRKKTCSKQDKKFK